jgi:hypothetical protein
LERVTGTFLGHGAAGDVAKVWIDRCGETVHGLGVAVADLPQQVRDGMDFGCHG